jgi:F-type H+-transporting ATPase subunit delta
MSLRVASRYSQALIDLALEQDSLEQVREDMLYLKEVCKVSREFLNLLRSPVVSGDKKTKILEKIAAGRIGPLTLSFANLLIRKGREGDLPEVIDAFLEQYNVLKDIHTLKLTTSVAVSEEIKQKIKDKVKEVLGLDKTVLDASVDEDLIGGFTLEFDGKMVDASIARELKIIHKQFTENVYVPKLFK